MNGKQNTLIHWFPGHMTKSLRLIEENLGLIDIVLYVLDARAPLSCLNPSFDTIVGAKPVIFVLNKADLVDSNSLAPFKDFLAKRSNNPVVSLNASTSKATDFILPIIDKMAKEKIERFKSKGVNASIRGMVIGVPNSGKSTLINNFCAKAKTVTGNKPGVTRGKQWVRVNDYFELLDTPGTLYPKLTDQTAARHLAYIGSVKDAVVDTLELAGALFMDLVRLAPKALATRYNMDLDDILSTDDEFSMDYKTPQQKGLEQIAKARGLMQKGGVLDIEKAAVALIDDFRKGRLGKVLLDEISD